MSDEPNTETAVEEVRADPLERAKANGYVEAEAPSREERVAALIRDFEHVMKHNSPISIAMMGELKALLAPDEAQVPAEGEPDPIV